MITQLWHCTEVDEVLLGQMELIFFVNYTIVANRCTYAYTTIHVMHKYTLMTKNDSIVHCTNMYTQIV